MIYPGFFDSFFCLQHLVLRFVLVFGAEMLNRTPNKVKYVMSLLVKQGSQTVVL